MFENYALLGSGFQGKALIRSCQVGLTQTGLKWNELVLEFWDIRDLNVAIPVGKMKCKLDT